MIFQVFDGVELDTARPKYLERAFRIPSARIVKKSYSFHRVLVWIFGEHKRCSGFDGNGQSGYNFTRRETYARESS
ncbi:MAG: hypothetical protein WAU82_18035 [Candidatus Binatus sp.]|uniref:hypothetical protein n=1 Tax=Candidatus Binatus sp. TaxID=2811406 RepID=UPI003BB1CF6D